jgi:hypothetical protein
MANNTTTKRHRPTGVQRTDRCPDRICPGEVLTLSGHWSMDIVCDVAVVQPDGSGGGGGDASVWAITLFGHSMPCPSVSFLLGDALWSL